MKKWKKVLSLFLCLSICLSIIPTVVFAEDAATMSEDAARALLAEEQPAEEGALAAEEPATEPESPEQDAVNKAATPYEEPAARANEEVEAEPAASMPDAGTEATTPYKEPAAEDAEEAESEPVAEDAITEEAANLQEEIDEAFLLVDDYDEDAQVCGPDLTWYMVYDNRLDGLKIVISGMGIMYDYTATVNGDGNIADCSSDFYLERDEILAVEVEDGITRIGSYAFAGFSKLKTVTLPASLKEIGTGAFAGCSSLWTVEFAEGTVMDRIGASAFACCSSVSQIDLPDGIKTIETQLFYRCSNLYGIGIPGSVTQIGNSAFEGCDRLEYVSYIGSKGEWDAIPVGANNDILYDEYFRIYYMKPKGRCGDKLTWTVSDDGTLTISGSGAMYDFDEEHIAPWSMESGIGIVTVVFEPGITSIGTWAFYHENLTGTVTIPAGVTRIGKEAFTRNGELDCVSLPASLTRIEDEAFYRTGITSVRIPASLTQLGDAVFIDCEALESITVETNNSTYTSQDGVLMNKQKTQLLCYPAGKPGAAYTVPDSVTSIEGSAFSSCNKLTSVKLHDRVTSIGAWAFSSCENLERVEIPAGLTQLGDGAFYRCGIPSVTIPTGITQIGEYMFAESGLTSVTIPGNIKSIGDAAFMRCKQLTEATIGTGVTSIGSSAFSSCTNLANISFLGSAPTFVNEPFYKVTARATYPNDNFSWTADVKQNYGGNLIWKGVGDSWIYWGKEKAIQLNGTIEECIQSTTSTSYSPELAYYLMGLARAVYSKTDVLWSLHNLGFESTNIRISSDLQDETNSDQYAAYALAKKQLGNGKTLVMIMARGTEGSEELAADLNVGTSPVLGTRLHIGFSESANRLYEDLKDFLGGTIPTSNTVYVLTGHSLGAATANLVSAMLTKAKVPQANLYDYNFACPDVGMATIIDQWENGYPNMFNIADARDPVAIVPGILGKLLSLTGYWTKYGKSRWFSYDWSNPKQVNLSISAHNKNNYVSYLESKPAFSSFYDRLKTAAARGQTIAQQAFYFITIKCPVDVVVYDSSGKAVAGVTNGVPNYYDSEFGDVFIATMGDEKAIAVPEDGNYVVKMSGTDNGEMEYDVYLADAVTQELEEEKKYEGVALSPGKEFVSVVSGETEVADVKLYVVDENEVPSLEVHEDGTEEALVATADKTQLQAAIAAMANLKEADYTAESWTAVQTALADARAALLKADASQEEVDVAARALSDAIGALVPAEPETPAEADKTQLEAAISYAEGLNAADYITESWAAVQSRLTTAKTVMAKSDATQEEVDQAVTDLDNAVAALEEKQEEPFRFEDVTDPAAYYYKPVYWAVSKGVTAGTSPTTFSPGRNCTRGQIVTFLWKAMDSPEPSAKENPFTDVKETDYFYKPVLWAKENGITSGTSATTFSPGKPCTRGQIVTFLWKAMGSPEPNATENSFTDVKETDYFYKPVLWAKENKITSGTSATTFSPGNTCTRAQAMTFLWIASGRPES